MPTAQENEDMKSFKQRVHNQIKSELEPAVQQKKQELLEKMKQARDDKAKKQQSLEEYNAAIWTIDQAGTERFKDEVLREKIRRSADGGWGDSSGDRSQSRIGGFVGDFAGQSDTPEWNLDGLAQQRPTPPLGHTRSKTSLGNNVSHLTGTRPGSSAAMYSNGARPSSRQDIQSTAKLTGVDEARIRKFAEEQARLERAHTPASSSPLADQAIRKFADEQARLHRAHSPEISRNDTHLKFAEEQARLRRTHSPELPRNDSQSKFAEEQARLNRTHSPDILRSESRPRPVHNPTGSSPGSTESARLAAFAEQQLRAQAQYAQESRNGTNSRLGQNAQTLRSKPSVPAYVPTGKRQSTFGRFPLNEPEDIRSMYDDDRTLSKVEVLFFDLDGTVLNWQGTVADELRRLGKNVPEFKRINWDQFALKWRDLYLETMRGISERGDSVSTNTVYRTTLDQLLSKESPKFVTRMTPTVRSQLADVWDRANAWPDTKDGLQAIQKTKTIATLSNMSLRTQTQMSRHAGLSWDVCLSGSLLGSYKPNPEAYLEAARSMSLVASKCAVVSSHFDELRVAGDAGMKTIYVRRPSEDRNIEAEITTKAERGYFDIVVDSFEHLAIVLGCDD